MNNTDPTGGWAALAAPNYNFYFREGFRRGYEDGYGRRYKYGRVSNGKIAILAGVLAGIVTYELIR